MISLILHYPESELDMSFLVAGLEYNVSKKYTSYIAINGKRKTSMHRI